MTAILGYARVSTTGQDLDAQLSVLMAVGVETGRIFTDKLSGSAKTDRPGLAALLDYARAGDTVVVAAIDRLGRSVAEVARTIADLGERQLLLRAVREGIDTSTPTGRAVAATMATLAELELELGRDAGRCHASPAAPVGCRPPSQPSSPPIAKSNCAGSRRPVNQFTNWPLPSELGEPLPTATLSQSPNNASVGEVW